MSVIGLFGLAGLAGALAAQRARLLHDRGWSLPATGAAWTLALIASIVAALAGHTVVGLLVAIVLLDIAIQGASILNQARLFAISRQARSRLNTAYVTGNFIGGAIGSAAASARGEMLMRPRRPAWPAQLPDLTVASTTGWSRKALSAR